MVVVNDSFATVIIITNVISALDDTEKWIAVSVQFVDCCGSKQKRKLLPWPGLLKHEQKTPPISTFLSILCWTSANCDSAHWIRYLLHHSRSGHLSCELRWNRMDYESLFRWVVNFDKVAMRTECKCIWVPNAYFVCTFFLVSPWNCFRFGYSCCCWCFHSITDMVAEFNWSNSVPVGLFSCDTMHQ